MNALQNKRPSQKSQPVMERLDLRIAPAAMPMAAVLVAEVRVETRQVRKWETSLTIARPGGSHERTLIHRIAGAERLIGRQDMRLARIEGQSAGGTGSQSSLPANVSQTLDVIYNAYTQDPAGFPANLPSTDGAGMVVIQGNNVGIQVQDGNPAEFNSLLTELQNDGMHVTISSAQYGTIVGLVPIAQLAAVASLPQAPSITPEFMPVTGPTLN
jgi:hypothetical protein